MDASSIREISCLLHAHAIDVLFDEPDLKFVATDDAPRSCHVALFGREPRHADYEINEQPLRTARIAGGALEFALPRVALPR
jgi:hypothetical protein